MHALTCKHRPSTAMELPEESWTFFAACREGKPHSCILIAEVVMVHANEGVLEKDDHGRPCVSLERLAPISRLGGLDYALTTATIAMEMPNHKMIT